MIHIGGNKMPSEGNEQRACSALMCFWFACICISLLVVVVVGWLLLLLAVTRIDSQGINKKNGSVEGAEKSQQ